MRAQRGLGPRRDSRLRRVAKPCGACCRDKTPPSPPAAHPGSRGLERLPHPRLLAAPPPPAPSATVIRPPTRGFASSNHNTADEPPRKTEKPPKGRVQRLPLQVTSVPRGVPISLYDEKNKIHIPPAKKRPGRGGETAELDTGLARAPQCGGSCARCLSARAPPARSAGVRLSYLLHALVFHWPRCRSSRVEAPSRSICVAPPGRRLRKVKRFGSRTPAWLRAQRRSRSAAACRS